MANYSLVINSKFQPFSFERYLQPYQIYGQAYREQEDALAEISDRADELAGKLNPSVDKETYARYQNYADALKAQSDELATRGLNPSSRRAMLALRSRYGKEIAPIKEAWDRRRELAKEQRALRGADSTIRFDNEYSTISLDRLMSNPEMSYVSLRGKDVAARTAEMAEQVMKSILTDPKYDKVKELGDQYFQQRLQQGYSVEQVISEITGKSDAPEALRRIRESIKQEISGNAAYDEAWADAFINRGMYHAIGTSRYDLVKNGEYIDAASRRRLTLDSREFLANYEPDGKGGYRRKPAPIRVPSTEKMIPVKGGGYYDPSTGTMRNEKGEIIPNNKGGALGKNIGAVGDSGTLPFQMLDYTGGGFDSPSSTDRFSVSDSKIYPATKLTPAQRNKLTRDLLPYGLTIDDVTIYEDVDWASANHYRVVPKGYNADGTAPVEEIEF